jgi:outer membrane biosynthesis protein TonB
MLPTGVDNTSSSSIFKGWAYNNAPKLVIWYAIRRYVPETPETRTQEILMDAKKAIAGSVVFDSLLRTANHGKPVHDPSSYKLLGGKGEEVRTAAPQADTQRLIQENSALRTELNKALQRLAAPAPVPAQTQAQIPQPIYVQVPASQPVQTQAPQPPTPVVRYQPSPAPEPVRTQAEPVVRVEQQQAPSAVIERQRRFAFMPTYDAPPEVQQREKRYGFAGKSSEKDIATMFGML